MTKTKIECYGKNNSIIISEACRINNCKFVVYGDNNIIRIQHDCEIKDTEFWCTDGSKILIGNNVHMVGDDHIASTEGKTIEIGPSCLFAHDVVIRNGDSHSIINSDGYRINPAKDVLVGNHVWIGQRAMVLKGTEIGTNCVIGAGTILSGKEYEAGTLIAGIPARAIKQDINWNPKIDI